ncbi:diphosphomevalonate decarboxylase [Candidatus Micrarchaeota archaeon]|nr:diphosphomevalonate decarboxylase [Candidatus Micrarchaeota archaeon]
MNIVTCEATANIAVVKYWGKRDDKLILPTNSSLSFTMDEQLRTRTSVAFDSSFKEDEFWLNGKKMDLTDKETAERLQQIDVIRKKAGITTKAKIVSLNCFPTAAGFASSAAGLAALACAASKAAGLNLSPSELSILARLGSGSACRSVDGGFVEWKMGSKTDGSDSIAVQIAPASHWPELRNVIAVVDAGKKKVSSRAGMKQTIATSVLYPARLQYVPKLIEEMKKAVLAKDFAKFGELTMRESSNMHAVMLDTWPSITYLNDYSKEIMYAVQEFNASKGSIKAAYTFDAGPNAHVYTTADQVEEVVKLLSRIEGVTKTMVCKVGEGPKYLNQGHLIDSNGNAKEARFDEIKKEIIVK